jgi:hypothetical protein
MSLFDWAKYLILLARPTGFEPVTHGLEVVNRDFSRIW